MRFSVFTKPAQFLAHRNQTISTIMSTRPEMYSRTESRRVNLLFGTNDSDVLVDSSRYMNTIENVAERICNSRVRAS